MITQAAAVAPYNSENNYTSGNRYSGTTLPNADLGQRTRDDIRNYDSVGTGRVDRMTTAAFENAPMINLLPHRNEQTHFSHAEATRSGGTSILTMLQAQQNSNTVLN